MPRLLLTDEHWSKLRPILLEQSVYDKPTLRLTVEGVLYRLRTGCPWRDLPAEFGNWNAIFKKFNYWSSKEKVMNVFQALVIEPDDEWQFIDSTSVRAHQHSSGAQGKGDEAIGRSRGGRTSKIHLGVDGYGLPLHFEISAGQNHDAKAAPSLLDSLPRADCTIADKAYDCEALRDLIRERSSQPIIPRKNNSTVGNDDIDWGLYRYRHLVENAFARLKHFRAIATRYDKLKHNFQAAVALACAFIWLPM